MLLPSKFRFGYVIGAALVALSLVLPLQGAGASDDLDTLAKGPAVGTPIPHQFNAPDQTNEIRSFTSLKAKNGLIVLFSRSFDW